MSPYLSHKSLTIGSYFQLFCNVEEGSLPVSFEWSRDGQTFKDNNYYRIEYSERHSILTIHKIEAKDAGNYSCIAYNVFGKDSQMIVLTIRGIVNVINKSYIILQNAI